MIVLGAGCWACRTLSKPLHRCLLLGAAAKSTGVCLVCMVLPGPRRRKKTNKHWSRQDEAAVYDEQFMSRTQANVFDGF